MEKCIKICGIWTVSLSTFAFFFPLLFCKSRCYFVTCFHAATYSTSYTMLLSRTKKNTQTRWKCDHFSFYFVSFLEGSAMLCYLFLFLVSILTNLCSLLLMCVAFFTKQRKNFKKMWKKKCQVTSLYTQAPPFLSPSCKVSIHLHVLVREQKG